MFLLQRMPLSTVCTSISCCSGRNLTELSLWLIRLRLTTSVLFGITSQVNRGFDQRPSLLHNDILSNVSLRTNNPPPLLSLLSRLCWRLPGRLPSRPSVFLSSFSLSVSFPSFLLNKKRGGGGHELSRFARTRFLGGRCDTITTVDSLLLPHYSCVMTCVHQLIHTVASPCWRPRLSVYSCHWHAALFPTHARAGPPRVYGTSCGCPSHLRATPAAHP
jgi:hypothetical protein